MYKDVSDLPICTDFALLITSLSPVQSNQLVTAETAASSALKCFACGFAGKPSIFSLDEFTWVDLCPKKRKNIAALENSYILTCHTLCCVYWRRWMDGRKYDRGRNENRQGNERWWTDGCDEDGKRSLSCFFRWMDGWMAGRKSAN